MDWRPDKICRLLHPIKSPKWFWSIEIFVFYWCLLRFILAFSFVVEDECGVCDRSGSVICSIKLIGSLPKSAAAPYGFSLRMLIYWDLCISLMSTVIYSLFSFLVEMFLLITIKMLLCLLFSRFYMSVNISFRNSWKHKTRWKYKSKPNTLF